jgi:L-aminopeptidase/D-esterase-like protein
MQPGKRNLITDIDGLLVGNADEQTLKSGSTVLTAERPFTAAVHIMGGAPGSRETDLLAPDKLVTEVDALVLSGGSALGLDAASGVANALRAAGRGFAVGNQKVPIVPAAILFDLLNGGEKGWQKNPYAALGEAAWQARAADFALGSVGAGAGATSADLKGGLGSASLVLENGLTVGALVAANPHGSVIQQGQPHFWAAPFEFDNEFGGLGPAARLDPGSERLGPDRLPTSSNTTIAIVATDAQLDKAACQRLATAAHDGMARAIMPSHTPFDGDLIFAAATGAKPAGGPADLLLLGHAAALCLARAIARAVWEASPAPGDTLPSFRNYFGV